MTDIFSAVSTRPPACLSTPALVFSSDLAKPNQVWWIFGTRGKSAILFSKSFQLPGQLRRFSLHFNWSYSLHVQYTCTVYTFNSVQYGVPFLYLLLIILSYLVLDPFFLITFFSISYFYLFPALNRVFLD